MILLRNLVVLYSKIISHKAVICMSNIEEFIGQCNIQSCDRKSLL